MKPATTLTVRLFRASLLLVALVALWEYGSRAAWWDAKIIPSPSAIGAYFLKGLHNGELLTACLVTMRRLLIGYFIGIIAGIPLGLLTARFQFASDTLGVLALGLQTLPSVCWVPLAIIWFHASETAMLFIVVMGTLWAVMLATDHGIRQIPPIYRRAASTMGSSGMHLLRNVLLPASLPHIVSGTKQGWAFAWRSLMGAELFVSIPTGLGLGTIMDMGRMSNDYAAVAAIMLVILIIGFVADKAIFSPWERFLRKRWGLTV
jgi:NitT/TauT family transport system permease protein